MYMPGTPFRFTPYAVRVAAVLAVLLPAGCAVGPDFVPPEPPKAARYTEQPVALNAAAQTPEKDFGNAPETAAQSLTQGKLPARWWEMFQNPKVNGLVDRAFSASASLEKARAALVQAQELWRAEAGIVWSPAVDATASATPQQITTAPMGSPPGMLRPAPFTLYSAGLSASYTFDLFGGNRRQLEALAAQVSFQEYELEAARLSLASNIVACAARDAGIRALIQATKNMLANRKKQVAIAQNQQQAGGASPLAVSVRKRELAELAATLPPLERALASNRHQLAVLVGSPPSEAALSEFTLQELALPRQLPVSLPGDLVRQRPDIRATEALLHKASAEVGVATANLYPRLTLVGSAGYNANHRSGLFLDSAGVWSIGASLLQPIFRGGELRARKRAGEAGLDMAAAAWKETVLHGYEDVANALSALESGTKTLAATREAAQEANKAYGVARQQYAVGAISLLDTLDAERKYYQMTLAEIQATLDRYTQTVTLFQALGGGWQQTAP